MIVNDAHRLLRDSTAHLHAATERAFEGFDLTGRPGYTAYLQAQAAAFVPLEAWLDTQDMASMLPDWPARRRAEALKADLRRLGSGVPEGPALSIAGHPLGVAYVLEGSRFGGRVLLKRARAGHDPLVAEACSFLDQPVDRAGWIALMSAVAGLGARIDGVVAAANAAFGIFGACARHAAATSCPNLDTGLAAYDSRRRRADAPSHARSD